MAIYSERFIRVTTAGEVVSWTVPDGMRAVLRCITLVNNTANPLRAECVAGGIAILNRSIQGFDSQTHGDLRVVMYAGEVLGVYLHQGGSSLSAHGYLFADDQELEVAARVTDADWMDTLPLNAPEVKG